MTRQEYLPDSTRAQATRVSVVIPCYNAEAYLPATLRSVAAQTHAPAEVIVVDDGSSDGGAAIAREAGATLVKAGGEGAPAARNLGAAQASGDAIMFLDADDLLGPSALEALVRALGQRSDAVARCPWFRLEMENSAWVTSAPTCADRAPWQDDLSAWLTGWYHPPCSILWSRAAYERSGGWDPLVRVNNDGDIMMRALLEGVPLVDAVDGAAYYRRLPGGAMSLSGRRFEEPGLRSRLYVLDRVSDRLSRRGDLGRYRYALAAAFDSVARDAGTAFPELSIQAEARARALAPLPPVRQAIGVARRRMGQASRLKRRLTATGRIQLPAPPAPRDGGTQPPATAPGPLVSVVIPTYNRKSVLMRALDSVQRQTHEALDIVVVDDASTDGTRDAVAALGDPRIRYICQPQNGGVGAARNKGIAEASGEFIAFLDSDDEWMPEKTERQLAAFAQASPRLGLVFTGVETVTLGEVVDLRERADRGHLLETMLRSNIIHSGSSAMIRRQVVDTVGGFDTDLPAIEDYDFFLRIARFFEMRALPDVLTRYHDDLPAEDSRERRSLNFAANMAARDTLFRRNRADMRHLGLAHLYLRDSAIRHFRSEAGSWGGAMAAAARAVAAWPSDIRSWGWLGLTAMPRQAQTLLRQNVSAGKRALGLGGAGGVALGRRLGKEGRAE